MLRKIKYLFQSNYMYQISYVESYIRGTFCSAENAGRKTKIPREKLSKMWACLARLFSFPEILENDVPFTTGEFQKLKLEFIVE